MWTHNCPCSESDTLGITITRVGALVTTPELPVGLPPGLERKIDR